jgi:hypothetical protein
MRDHFLDGWKSKTGHNAPSFIKSKYNCDAAIRAYIFSGVPSNIISMGLSLNGHG